MFAYQNLNMLFVYLSQAIFKSFPEVFYYVGMPTVLFSRGLTLGWIVIDCYSSIRRFVRHVYSFHADTCG